MVSSGNHFSDMPVPRLAGNRFLTLEIELESVIAGVIPAWIIEIIIPIGFFLLAFCFPLRILDRKNDEQEAF
jgi:hypothetical protein